MLTTPIEGEGNMGVKMFVSIVYLIDYYFMLNLLLNWGQRPRISLVNLNWDELATNL